MNSKMKQIQTQQEHEDHKNWDTIIKMISIILVKKISYLLSLMKKQVD